MAKTEEVKKVAKKAVVEDKPKRVTAASMSVSEKQIAIKKLLTSLKTEEDAGEKRKIRAKLRALGHSGGLGEGRGRPGAGKPKAKAKGAADEVEDAEDEEVEEDAEDDNEDE